MSLPVKKVTLHLQNSQNRILIKSGKIVNDNEIVNSDIYIEDGVIKSIGNNLIIPGGTRIIDAKGKYVFPGGIDPSTHLGFENLGLTGADNFYQGTRAAIAGGTTTIIDYVLPKVDENLIEAYQRFREKADGKVCCNYALHVVIRKWYEGIFDHMKILVEEHGINSFMMYMASDDENLVIRHSDLIEPFKSCKTLGAIAMVHPENGDIVSHKIKSVLAAGITGSVGHEIAHSVDAELMGVYSACVTANQLNCPLYITSLTSQSSVEIINSSKKETGLPIFGETLACYLGVSKHQDNIKNTDELLLITNPPIRSDPSVPIELMHNLKRNEIDVVASNHCTFEKKLKLGENHDFSKIPSGTNGIEERLSVTWDKGVNGGIIDPTRFVAVTSSNSARIFNLYPKKGVLAIGSDADIVVWDPNKSNVISAKQHHLAIDYNIFEGLLFKGVPEYVIVNGRVCVNESELKAVEGLGKFIACSPYSKIIYDKIEKRESLFRSKEATNL